MDIENNICSICYELKRDETNTFVCAHNFCQGCIVQWYQQCETEMRLPCCPMCRKIDIERIRIMNCLRNVQNIE